MLLLESESITLGITALILAEIQAEAQKKIFQINLLVKFVDLITKIFGFENSLFSWRRKKKFVSVRDYQVPEQKK